MLGTCVLHSFVVEDEKDEYRKALAEALDEAERANMAKTAFLSNMSHMQAGLDAHLSKPVEPETLFGTLRDLMGRRQDPEQ